MAQFFMVLEDGETFSQLDACSVMIAPNLWDGQEVDEEDEHGIVPERVMRFFQRDSKIYLEYSYKNYSKEIVIWPTSLIPDIKE